MDRRLMNLLGVVALAATDELLAGLAQGGSAPAALVHVDAHPGGSVEELRQVLGISQPATVRAIDRLVGEGLLERRAGPDRRTRALHLTQAGKRAADEVLLRRTESLRGVLDGLDADEQAALLPLLERLAAGLAEDRPEAMHACRLCDRPACTSGAGCPLAHTA